MATKFAHCQQTLSAGTEAVRYRSETAVDGAEIRKPTWDQMINSTTQHCQQDAVGKAMFVL